MTNPTVSQFKNIKGTYINGLGRASEVAKTKERSDLLAKWFGSPLFGTFNIHTEIDTKPATPNIADGIHRFYYLRIEVKGQEPRYGWAYRWDGSRQRGTTLEVYSRALLPSAFKTNPLKITFLSKWNAQQIEEWRQGQNEIQGFEWSAAGDDFCEQCWDKFSQEDIQRKTVLHSGMQTGYFAMQAAKAGAIAEGISQDLEKVQLAKTINENIEQTDALFRVEEVLPASKWDYIFECAGEKWVKTEAFQLIIHMKLLKSRCKVLYLEISNPQTSGCLSAEMVSEVVGGEKVHETQTNSNQLKTLYRIKGDLK